MHLVVVRQARHCHRCGRDIPRNTEAVLVYHGIKGKGRLREFGVQSKSVWYCLACKGGVNGVANSGLVHPAQPQVVGGGAHNDRNDMPALR